MKTVLIALGGACFFTFLALNVASGTLTAVLCVVGFLAGGMKLRISSTDGDDRVELDTLTALTIGSALALGRLAVVPVTAAVLGHLFLTTGERLSFGNAIRLFARYIAQAALTGLAFELLHGQTSSPAAMESIAASVGAAFVYLISHRLLSHERVSHSSMAVSLGAGYGLAGAVRAIPPFAILAVSLPFAVALLGLLRQARKTQIDESEEKTDDESTEETAARPSLLDPLTGLANQRYLQMFLQQEISRSERSGQPISVMLVDIDDFGQLNESEGDEAANRCLMAVGSALRRMLRDYDVVGRYKDDEFLIILPDTTEIAGHETAVRLHAALSGQILPNKATFSLGVATYPTYGATVDDLLSSAHHALNRAKFSGKNSIRSCHELAKAS